MKKVNKIIFVTILFLAITMAISVKSQAVTPIFPYSCSRGVCVYYYIENGSGNGYYNLIKAAAYNWEHTGHGYNPIYLYEKSASSGTAMDFYNKTTAFWGNSSVLGETFHRNGSGSRIDPYSSHWLYSEIFLNTSTLSKYSDTVKQGTIGHEMGHAFGLAHYNSNPNGSIMCQLGYGRTANTVQLEDNQAINQKYGN